ncbi:MAG TPA: DinB family protein [Acetobacteraceae bacterium]|nr:DinB family protein [Acetobacteraceae bacterium]
MSVTPAGLSAKEMHVPKVYRQGPLGALIDEYERAAGELARLVEGLSDEEYELVRDPGNEFPSVRAILAHVVAAGHGHAGLVRKAWGLERGTWSREGFSRQESGPRLRAMLDYTSATLEGKWAMTEDEMSAVQMRSGWGVMYDLEQLFEHTIVHVLRHRRQIERLLAR